VKAVYHPNSDLLHVELGSHPSQIWRAIIEVRDVLACGLIKRIGNGKSTSIWGYIWLPRDHMMCPIACLSNDETSRLVIMLLQHRGIKQNQKNFMQVDVDAILGMPLNTCNIEDFCA
jgi:hypothetical protein